MKRFFITYKDADQYNIMMDFDEITLTDKRLIVKKPETNGAFSLENIKETGLLSEDEVAVYDYQCDIKGGELLIEIDESDLINVDNKYVQEFTLLENNKYKQEGIKFEKRSFKLLEYGAYNLMNKLEKTLVEIIPVISSPIEPGRLLVKETTDNGSVYTIGETTNTRRVAFGKDVLGGDLYLKVSDKLLDKYHLWVTEFTESKKNIYEIASKNYLLLKLDEAEKSINKETINAEKRFLENIKNNSLNVHLSKATLKINLLDDDSNDIKAEDIYSIVRREDLYNQVKGDIEKLPFKKYFRVIHQFYNEFSERPLEDALIEKSFMETNPDDGFNLELTYD